MDSVACCKMPPVVRKVKKKQVKDEMDRLKQAEKKKRRLEKALATSAAIRSELEKKKQKKKEEQQRLDEEGAAIAEAVALHVLLGEDSDDLGNNNVLQKNEGFNRWDTASNIDRYFMGGGGGCGRLPHRDLGSCSRESVNTYGTKCKWNGLGSCDWSASSGSFGIDVYAPYFEGGWGSTEVSADVIAAQAVSSLHITEDADVVDSIVFD